MLDRKADKEMAEEYADSVDGYEIKTYSISDIEEAYLAGLKAGRSKWHKVADGDLPEDGVQVLSEKGHIVIYKSDCFHWFEYSPNADNIRLRNWEKPIAWREKPKFDEV